MKEGKEKKREKVKVCACGSREVSQSREVPRKKEKKSGDAGYRSPCPSHAKRMLYHLSYIPSTGVGKTIYISTQTLGVLHSESLCHRVSQCHGVCEKNASGGVRTHAFCNSRS